jgi:hypothetical protein
MMTEVKVDYMMAICMLRRITTKKKEAKIKRKYIMIPPNGPFLRFSTSKLPSIRSHMYKKLSIQGIPV